MSSEVANRHILLVEDDDNDAELTKNVLNQFGIINKIIRVSDGEEALDYFYRRNNFQGNEDPYPAVVLLDLKMPRVNGIEVLQEIKSNDKLKTIPVIILTSSSEETDLKTCYQLGVNAYVVKPVDIEQFRNAIKELGIFWLLINTPPKNGYH